MVVLKTWQQVGQCWVSCVGMVASIVKSEGIRGLYRGFETSLTGTIPARALYIAALEVTKSEVGGLAVRLGCSKAAAANAIGELSVTVAAQLVWTPADVVSQRLIVCNINDPNCRYVNGIDACKKIVRNDGVRGLYKRFRISILTYAPSNGMWWASYSVAQRAVWGRIGCYYYSRMDGDEGTKSNPNEYPPLVILRLPCWLGWCINDPSEFRPSSISMAPIDFMVMASAAIC
ncbi:hypothetical protein LWI28_005851 [Acer negundo]|uniref:Uncharacterized protein n=1 Tax=Acer negundo TaxID=4023 RepID=A0AAD5NI86_ACENE|nr:hypothetical protein LWI28_005851 [Acer negundo]